MQPVQLVFPVPKQGPRLDLAPHEVPVDALITAQNMVFRRGRFQPRYGSDDFGSNTVSGTPIAMFGYLHSNGTQKLVVMTSTKWYQYAAGAWSDITGGGLTGSPTSGIFRVFQKDGETHLIGCDDGKDTPKTWNGTAGAYSSMGGAPPKPKCMAIINRRLVLFNLTNGGAGAPVSPVAFDVSDFNDFNTGWGTVQFGLLNDTPGDIMGALEMGDLQTAVYKSDAIVMAQAVGSADPLVFAWRVIGNIGPASPRAIVALPNGTHAYLAVDGSVRLFDGSGPDQSAGYPIQKQILDAGFQTNSPTAMAASWGYMDKFRNELIFVFSASGVYRWIVISLDNMSAWVQRPYGSVVNMYAGGQYPIPGSSTVELLTMMDGGVSIKETGYRDYPASSDNIAWFFQTGNHDGGVPKSWKTVREVDHMIGGIDDPSLGGPTFFSQLAFALYGSDGGQDPIALSGVGGAATASIVAQSDTLVPYTTGHRTGSRRFSLRYSGTLGATSMPFEWRGAVVDAAIRGER